MILPRFKLASFKINLFQIKYVKLSYVTTAVGSTYYRAQNQTWQLRDRTQQSGAIYIIVQNINGGFYMVRRKMHYERSEKRNTAM